MTVLIPSYEPDHRLLDTVAELRLAMPQAQILVVDDGSGASYRDVFTEAAALGATVVGYPQNRGKGAALRSGFRWVTEHRPSDPVVCADSDGQHSVADIVRVADAITPGVMVLGGRRFAGVVPARSRFGNSVTRHVFRTVTGAEIFDTQTGLRGYPHDLLEWMLAIPGDRFEYEFNALLQAVHCRIQIVEIEIATIYDPDEYSTHFRTVSDSLRIYAPLAGHAARRLVRH